MNSPCYDLAEYLSISGGSMTMGANLFLDEEPSTPDEVVTMHDIGGSGPEPMLAIGESDLFDSTIYITSRAARNGRQQAYINLLTLALDLQGLGNVVINSTRYLFVFMISDIVALGQDENDRPSFSVSLRVKRTPI